MSNDLGDSIRPTKETPNDQTFYHFAWDHFFVLHHLTVGDPLGQEEAAEGQDEGGGGDGHGGAGANQVGGQVGRPAAPGPEEEGEAGQAVEEAPGAHEVAPVEAEGDEEDAVEDGPGGPQGHAAVAQVHAAEAAELQPAHPYSFGLALVLWSWQKNVLESREEKS